MSKTEGMWRPQPYQDVLSVQVREGDVRYWLRWSGVEETRMVRGKGGRRVGRRVVGREKEGGVVGRSVLHVVHVAGLHILASSFG